MKNYLISYWEDLSHNNTPEIKNLLIIDAPNQKEALWKFKGYSIFGKIIAISEIEDATDFGNGYGNIEVNKKIDFWL